MDQQILEVSAELEISEVEVDIEELDVRPMRGHSCACNSGDW